MGAATHRQCSHGPAHVTDTSEPDPIPGHWLRGRVHVTGHGPPTEVTQTLFSKVVCPAVTG